MHFDGSSILCHRSSFARKDPETGEVLPPTLTGGGFRSAMSGTPSRTGNQHEAKDYELRVQGHIAARWATHLEAASLVNEPDGTTRLLVRLLDQATLQGLLQKIRDVGPPLVSVTPADRGRADHATIDPY